MPQDSRHRRATARAMNSRARSFRTAATAGAGDCSNNPRGRRSGSQHCLVGDAFGALEAGIAQAAAVVCGLPASHPFVAGSERPFGIGRRRWMATAAAANVASLFCLLLASAGQWSTHSSEMQAFAWFGTSAGPGNLWCVRLRDFFSCIIHHHPLTSNYYFITPINLSGSLPTDI
jgi:hypothetical protein